MTPVSPQFARPHRPPAAAPVRQPGRWLAVLALCLAAASICAGQQRGATSDESGRKLDVVQRQNAIRERLDRLEARMLRLSQLLAETEPDKSEKLGDALNHSRERRIKKRIEELATLLRTAQYSDAEREQEQVLADLEAVLTLLTDTLGDLDRKRAERERLAALRREIQRLITDQQQNLHGTQQILSERQQALKLRELAERLERAAEQQARLRRSQNAHPSDDPSQPAKQQEALETQTREAAEEIKKLARSAAEEQGDAQAAAALEDAGKNAQDAADKMKQAGEALKSRESQAAEQAQTEAEQKLRRAIARLRKQADKLAERDKMRAAERAQRRTERKAADTAGRMGQSSDKSRGNPGKQQMEKARENMQKAADKLGERRPKEAEQEQSAALDEMQRALDELDDALRQMRREEMEETLAALEVRLRSMLANEQAVLESVVDLDAKGRAAWTRLERLQLSEATDTQRTVTEECEAVHRILVQEGTTVAFPEIVKQLADDMAAVGRSLKQADTTAPVRATLADIIEELQELVAAVEAKREQERNRPDGDRQRQNGDDQTQPLLPASAELKLLRRHQLRLIRRTASLDVSAELAPGARRAQFERVTQRQRQLADLARKINERGKQ